MSVRIRDIIETLCQLLHYHGYYKLTAEVIRQAKFDKEEARPALLLLLYSITEAKVIAKKFVALCSVLSTLSYPRLQRIVSVTESTVSSRELLLAFGFLLERLHLEEKCLVSTLNFLTLDVKFTPLPDYERQSLNELVVFRTKINLCLRGMMSSTRRFCRLIDRLMTLDTNHISEELRTLQLFPLDLILYENKSLQMAVMNTLKEQNVLLSLNVKWLKHERFFWEWMESVCHQTRGTHWSSTVSHYPLKDAPCPFSETLDKMEAVVACVNGLLLNPQNEKPNSSRKSSFKILEDQLKVLAAESKAWLQHYHVQCCPDFVKLPPLH